ncbi:hypothetical protein [Pseudomonas aeruginosa]|uniref:hypothetical protein n=1 Tax=Pseudomonas aeruginosa TaxID=287 RepID=UPI000B1145E4|nr:hypothetical protein [Pseudomonas aeruginosa]
MLVLTRDLDFIEDAFSIVQAMRRFLSGESLTCEVSGGRLSISSLGKVVYSFLEYDYCGLRQALDGSRGHPYLSVMEKIVDAYRNQAVFDWSFGGGAEGLKALEDHVRLEIESEGGGDALRGAARSIVRGVRKNYAGLDAFISDLASKEQGLNAVSVDLRYVHDVFCESGEGHSAELVRCDLDALLKIVDKKFSSSISGYFWRIEFGLGRKFYARVVFFVDGAVAQIFFDFLKGESLVDVLKVSKGCFLSVYDFIDGGEFPGACLGEGGECLQKIKANVALQLAADELIRADFSNRRVYGRSGRAKKYSL